MPAYGTPSRSVYPGENAYAFGSIDRTSPPPAGQADSNEVAEAIAVGSKSVCIAIAPVVGIGYAQRTITWETTINNAPTTLTLLLEGAMRDIDGEYVTIDTSTSTTAEVRQTQITQLAFFRVRCSVRTGTAPTAVVKLKSM